MGSHTVQGLFQQPVVHIPCGQILTVLPAFCQILLFAHLGNHGFLIGINKMPEVCLEIRG